MKYAILLFTLFCSLAASAQSRAQKAEAMQVLDSMRQLPSVKVYPKVADKYVNVYVECKEPTDIVITILPSELNNMAEWKLNSRSEYQKNIDVTQLPNGDYWLTVTGKNVDLRETFTVKK